MGLRLYRPVSRGRGAGVLQASRIKGVPQENARPLEGFSRRRLGGTSFAAARQGVPGIVRGSVARAAEYTGGGDVPIYMVQWEGEPTVVEADTIAEAVSLWQTACD